MPQQRKNDATKSDAIITEIHFIPVEKDAIATRNYAIKSQTDDTTAEINPLTAKFNAIVAKNDVIATENATTQQPKSIA